MEATQRRIRIFHNRHPLVGPIFWIVSLQYFIIQVIVARAWPQPFSLSAHVISDLGNTACGMYADRYVCSPMHPLMNVSFVALGLLMIAGSVLIYQGFRQTFGSRTGFTFMALAGFGTILVGLFPENINGPLHFIGALLPFVLGNIALLIFGFWLGLPRTFRAVTILSGVIALVALVLFQAGIYLDLGEGGMERVVAYPQTVWLILFGIYLSKDRFKTITQKVAHTIRSPKQGANI